jgi:hypothetical protein
MWKVIVAAITGFLAGWFAKWFKFIVVVLLAALAFKVFYPAAEQSVKVVQLEAKLAAIEKTKAAEERAAEREFREMCTSRKVEITRLNALLVEKDRVIGAERAAKHKARKELETSKTREKAMRAEFDRTQSECMRQLVVCKKESR